MLKITIPNNNINERKYIIEIILNEFLGLSYSLEIGSKDYQITLKNGKVLTIRDTFFNKYLKDFEYLKEEQEKYGLIYGFRSSTGVLEKAIELINNPNLKKEFQKRRQKMLSDKIDVTAFMTWFVENYPDSASIMHENPVYQNRFR